VITGSAVKNDQLIIFKFLSNFLLSVELYILVNKIFRQT
jgi:hypothetical protein